MQKGLVAESHCPQGSQEVEGYTQRTRSGTNYSCPRLVLSDLLPLIRLHLPGSTPLLNEESANGCGQHSCDPAAPPWNMALTAKPLIPEPCGGHFKTKPIEGNFMIFSDKPC